MPGSRLVSAVGARLRISFALALAGLAIALLLAACGPSTQAQLPKLPGGTYTSDQYHFKVTYPTGWSTNVQSQPSQPIPLVITITRTDAVKNATPVVSTFTVMVFNLRDPSMAKTVTSLTSNHDLRKITLAGKPAYAATPVDQPIQDTNIAVTHMDYFLVTADYEYQISTDDVHGENAADALKTMLQSFTLLKS
jgi:major membrane immunogen (membrane-anchored lipoprotein)